MFLTEEEYNSINFKQCKKQLCWCCDKTFYYFPKTTPIIVHPIGKEIGYDVTCPYCGRNFFTR